MNFLEIKNTKDLAEYLGISNAILAIWAYGPARNGLYKRFEIKKKSGGTRVILSPERTLRKTQRKIADELKNHYRRHEAAFGFVDKYSIADNANRHVGSRWVLNLDLEDFFPSIHFGRVRGMLLKPPFAFPMNVAQWLAQIVTFDKTLPQGSPSSPIISNMICLRLDKDLKKLARRYDLIYTRYADDITLSSKEKFPDAIAKLNHSGEGASVNLGDDLVSIINDNGFQIKHSKTRMTGTSRRQEVTGVVVNEKCNLPRQYLNGIRGEIGRLRYLKGDEYNELRLKVLGRMGHLKNIVGEFDARYLKLKAKLNGGIRLSGNTSLEFFYRATAWIVENEDTGVYGTVYYIKGLGWITAMHVVDFAKVGGYRIFHPDAPESKYHIQLKSNYFDEDIDYVVLISKARPIASLKPADTPINNGETCTLVGYPSHNSEVNSVSFMEAKITSSHKLFKALRLVVDKQIFHGMSGGPVFNKEKCLVGIVTHGSKDGGELITQSAFTSIHLVMNDIADKTLNLHNG